MGYIGERISKIFAFAVEGSGAASSDYHAELWLDQVKRETSHVIIILSGCAKTKQLSVPENSME